LPSRSSVSVSASPASAAAAGRAPEARDRDDAPLHIIHS
jgi:hypothetical protein